MTNVPADPFTQVNEQEISSQVEARRKFFDTVRSHLDGSKKKIDWPAILSDAGMTPAQASQWRASEIRNREHIKTFEKTVDQASTLAEELTTHHLQLESLRSKLNEAKAERSPLWEREQGSGRFRALSETIELADELCREKVDQIASLDGQHRDIIRRANEALNKVEYHEDDPQTLPSIPDCLKRKRTEPNADKPRLEIEPISELIREDVPDEQICRMYRFTDQYGEPSVWKVRSEIDDPGRHTWRDKSWIDPVAESRVAAERSRREAEQPKSQRKPVRESPKAKQPCPETSEELWAQEVPLPQAARMLCREEKEVKAEWDRFKQGQFDDAAESPEQRRERLKAELTAASTPA